MLKFFGTLFLWSALAFAMLQSIPPLVGYYRKNNYLLALARPAALGQFLCIAAAYILLTIAFVVSDFSIAYVGMNSHPLLPLMYRLTAVWGGHEGSILLWIVLINIWTMVFVTLQRKHELMSLTTAVLGAINVCFLLFLVFTSNPFLPATTILSGSDLNPLLQDPGFVIHPPMLYTGYVGFAVTFALTQAALLRGKLDESWAFMTRRYALAAWCFLTFGITLGSWWAYRVLGWGGFWFWDPVENASLLPWLAGTALIHVLIMSEKRHSAIAWSVLLALITFILSILGTFLVRSGVLISAHTFANDPERGVFLLLLLAVVLAVSLVIYLARLSRFTNAKAQPFQFISRETSLLINSGLLFIAMLTVLLGTIYPLIIDALHLDAISVGAPYFNMVMAPLVFVLMAFMGIGPLCQWQETNVSQLVKQLAKQALISLITALVLLWCVAHTLSFTALLSLFLSMWVITSVLSNLRIKPALACAHIGFAVLIIGVLMSSLLNEERETRLFMGNSVSVGPYQFFLVTMNGVQGSNYKGVQATFDVMKNTRHITNLYPEKRIYLVRDMVMTKVDIHPGIFRDLYIALGEPYADNSWSVRVYYKPFVRWIWAGSAIMILGGLFSITGYRRGRKTS